MAAAARFPSMGMTELQEGITSIWDLPSDHLLSRTGLDGNPSADQAGLIDVSTLAAHDFDVDVRTAFLPPAEPIARLSGAYGVWERAWEASRDVGRDDEGKLARRWRAHIEDMTVVRDIGSLNTIPLMRRAHVVLTFLLHRYIHSLSVRDSPCRVPDAIAVPLLAVSRKLDLPPVLTYADTVLWNWRLRSPTAGFSIENLDLINSFTGTGDERHFYMVSALIEMLGAPAMRLMSATLDEAFLNDTLARIRITSHLTSLASQIDLCTAAVASMRSACSPSVFYHIIRPWFNSFPLLLDGEMIDFGGPSAGQSSFVHSLDLFLGIAHTAEDDSAESTFLQRMLQYMPGAHRTFLRHLETEALPVRAMAMAEGSPALSRAYDGCVDAVRKLREEHMRLVTVFVIAFARKEKGAREAEEALGTGGTRAMDLLKRTRLATIQARLE